MTALSRLLRFGCVAGMLIPALASEFAHSGEVSVDGRTFRVPDGFVIERVAGAPLVDRPIVGDFDEQGRLYLADSSGTNDPVKKQLADKPHRIVRLEDVDGDGRFDRSTVFADRMMFPEGVMWHDGSLYVGAPPSIWKLTDADGDGVAETRSEWFQGKTLNGCANDLHGPYLGLDGWIYWCKGAFEQQTYERPGRSPLVTRAAHIFRCRPDWSGVEAVMTGGMDNPVDVTFTPGGERIFTTTFFQIPAGGRRDGLVHAVYGGVYGKVHNVLDGHPWTGPEVLPPMTHLGPAAPCGLTRYESDAFGSGYKDNLFATLFNLQKVTRHVVSPSGATFTTKDEDFLATDDRDFHPTDVFEDADGSLIVIDTGGWYKICCPTSQLHKPDVLGAIYRVRRQGAPRVEDPRGLKIAWQTLTAEQYTPLLSDPRRVVRQRAIAGLAKKGPEAIPVIAEIIQAGARSSSEAKCAAIWTATRMTQPEARAAVRAALTDQDETVRQAALHSVSVGRDHEAIPRLLETLKGSSAQNRRAAAEGLGRMGEASVVPALLDAAGAPADRMLEHSLTFALIEIGDGKGTAAGLKSANVRTQRAALIALDQMEKRSLSADALLPALAANDPALKEAASWIAGQHPEWGEALAGYFRGRLAAGERPSAETVELQKQLSSLARGQAVQELLADRLRDRGASRPERKIVLGAMAQSGLRDVPKSWIDGLTQLVAGDDAELIRQAIGTTRAITLPKAGTSKLRDALLAAANRTELSPEIRLEALAALPAGLETVTPEIFDFLRGRLGPDQSVAARGAASDVLAKAALAPGQLAVLTESFQKAGPLEVGRMLGAYTRTTDPEVGGKLVAALLRSPALSSLRADAIRPVLAKYGPEVKKQAEALYAKLEVDSVKQKARLEGMLTSINGGDIRRGQTIFNSQKAACSSCHAVGYLGGKVGPDLTKIGQIRSERDLLEAIVFPSASFVRSFEPIVVATSDGKVVNGLLKKDSSDEIVLATGPDQEARIARGDIDEMRPSTVSVMPAGLDQQLSTKELADLVAFLRACR